MKKSIPNLLTALNMFSGCIAAWLAFENNLTAAALFVGLGIFFDFFDGMAARKLGVSGELGTQLDSLADMITSGLVPGIVMIQLMAPTTFAKGFSTFNTGVGWLAFSGFLIALASGFRLAKFNIDERQTSSFIGLPTPANAILILSFALIREFHPESFLNPLIENFWFLLGITILSCYLLNAELKLFSLKINNFKFKDNRFRYILVLSALALAIFFRFQAIPLIILLYLILSLIEQKSKASVQ